MLLQITRVNEVLRIKLLKDCKHGKSGDIIQLDNNESFGLIDSGFAEITKDITSTDIKTKSDEEQADGNPIIVRSNKSK